MMPAGSEVMIEYTALLAGTARSMVSRLDVLGAVSMIHSPALERDLGTGRYGWNQDVGA